MTGTLHAAVLGHPVDHSLSPALHAAAYAELGLDADYVRHDVPEQQWDGFWSEARSSGHWRGFSVTMPLKRLAARDANRVTPLARALGVANTLTFAADGTVAADNTDVMGIMAALGVAGEIPDAPRAAVLGGGATASAAVAALHGLGAHSVDVVVRTAQRAESLTAVAHAVGTTVRVLPWERAGAALSGADVVVATLPPRGADEVARSWHEEGARVSGVLLDAAYDPWPSALAAAWRDAGGAIAPGVDMLIYQAVDQLRWFTQGDASRALPREDAVTEAMCRAVDRPARGVPQRVRRAQDTRLPH